MATESSKALPCVHMFTHTPFQKDSREQQLIIAQHDRAARVAVVARGGLQPLHYLQEVVGHDGGHCSHGRC